MLGVPVDNVLLPALLGQLVLVHDLFGDQLLVSQLSYFVFLWIIVSVLTERVNIEAF